MLYIISTSKRLIDQYHFTDITDDVPQNAGIDNLCVQLNYDILMYYIAKDSEKYQQQGNNLQDTPIITNMSLRTDYHITESDVLARHPETIILHQKF